MLEKRGNWLTRAMLVIGLLAFVGLGLLPLLDSAIEADRSSSATAEVTPTNPTNTLGEVDRAELEARERGYELVVQREPENQTALKGLIEVRMELEDIEGTLDPLKKLAELNPEEPRYGVLVAQTQYAIGDREAAAATYRDVLSDRPGNMEALQGLVSLLLAEERPQAAIGVLENTLQTAPRLNEVEPGSIDTVSVQLLLGQVYAQQGRNEEAIAIYDNIAESQPDDFRPLLGKAIVFRNSGKTADALPLLKRARDLAPSQFQDPIIAEIERLEGGAPPVPAPETEAEETEEGEPEAEGTDVPPPPEPESP